MARPLKDGVDYFPLDTDFLQDDKVRLIKSEFGAKGILILISLLCEIYKDNGYFKVWNNDSCLLMADAVGCGIVPENITQVVQGCLRRSIFNDGVFQMFGILTSAGIQRRYIRMFPNRKQIALFKEYWLLNAEDEKDVPASVLNKLTFKTVKKDFNPDKNNGNPDKNTRNPQSKVKESKAKKRKEDYDITAATDFYEQNIGLVPRHVIESMQWYMGEGLEIALITETLCIAVNNNVLKWSYANVILKDCLNKGIKLLKDFKAEKEERKQNGYNHDQHNGNVSTEAPAGELGIVL